MGWSILKDLSADTTGNNTGWSGYTMRHVYKHGVDINGYPGLGSGGTKIRISLRGGQTSGLVVDKVYVGLRAASGDVYDFASTPTQITWAGGGSVSAGVLANTATSDEIPFAFDGTTDIVIAVHFSGTTNLLDIVGSETGGLACYYVAGDSAATVNASASQAFTTAYAIGKVEVFATSAGDQVQRYIVNV